MGDRGEPQRLLFVCAQLSCFSLSLCSTLTDCACCLDPSACSQVAKGGKRRGGGRHSRLRGRGGDSGLRGAGWSKGYKYPPEADDRTVSHLEHDGSAVAGHLA